MRLFSKAPSQQRSSSAVHQHLLLSRDFLRMFVAAIAVGLVFSAAAVILTLLLAGTADANVANGATVSTIPSAPHHTSNNVAHNPYETNRPGSHVAAARPAVVRHDDPKGLRATALSAAGNLLMTDGCGGDLIYASERDIQITISQNRADIQVMQTFVIGSNGGDTKQSAIFQAGLPNGAYFQGMRVQTDGAVLFGQFSGGINWDLDDTADARQLKSRGLIRYFQSQQLSTINSITTDRLTQLGGGESIVVTYHYQIPVLPSGDISAISLALSDVQTESKGDNSNHQPRPPTNIATSIWVIWMAPPKQIYRPPVGLTIERSADQTARIEGASWQSSTRPEDGKFQLAWIH